MATARIQYHPDCSVVGVGTTGPEPEPAWVEVVMDGGVVTVVRVVITREEEVISWEDDGTGVGDGAGVEVGAGAEVAAGTHWA